jgi:predicted dehydrogenase
MRPIHPTVAGSRARLSGRKHRPARQVKALAARMAMIRVAVIGAGQWGPNLIRNFHNKQTSEVVWIIDRDATRLEEVHAHFPDVQIAKDPEQALRDSCVNAVVVATPTSTHYALAKEALERRKHVLVEKPLTTEVKQGLGLLELATKYRLTLMVGHVFLYNPAVRKVKEYLDAGHLGDVYYVSMVRTNLGPIRVDVNAAWDLAAHDLSIANYWLNAEPLSVSAMGGTWINKGIEDAVFATLRYPKGVLVNLHASWLNPCKARDITVVGERRMLTFDDMNLNEPLRIYDKQVSDVRIPPTYVDSFASFRASIRKGDVTVPKVPLGEPLATQCAHFLECIVTGNQPFTSAGEGIAVVRALEAMQRSIRAGGREEQLEPC